MRKRGLDITGTVDITDPTAVNEAVARIFSEVYGDDALPRLARAFNDITVLFRGQHPHFHPCDTPYHDLQHVLDVTLAMARIVGGHDRSQPPAHRLGPDMALLGVVVALFHDVGYLRRRHDRRHGNGAEYTSRHIDRGARFLASYLPGLGMDRRQARMGRILIRFTAYGRDVPVTAHRDPVLRKLGAMLGSADLLAQMSDRCYLEKCRDRLYFELNLARRHPGPDGTSWSFDSPEDLIRKTPGFFRYAIDKRLNGTFQGVHEYARLYLSGRHAYMDAIEKNRRHLMHALNKGDLTLLRRRPPWTLTVRPEKLGIDG
jgi:hypothetical protein